MIAAMPAPLPPPDFDAGAAYPEVNPLRAALAAGDWPAVRDIFAGLDPAARTLLVRFGGDQEGVGPFLHRVHAAEPTDPLAGALLGGHLIAAGWRIRSSYRAKHVSRDQFAQFHDHLRRAEQVLIDVTARHPDDAAAWTHRITNSRGLELGQSESRRRYDQLSRHHPHHLAAQGSLLQQLCPKWSGSWQEAHAFAQECTLAAPPGAPNAVLVAEAHLEQAFDGVRRKAVDHLRQPQVTREINEAAQRSVWHPDFRNGPGWVWVRTTFAVAFSLIGDHASAAAQYTQLGGVADEVWYFRDPAKAIQKFRAEAYEKVGQA